MEVTVSNGSDLWEGEMQEGGGACHGRSEGWVLVLVGLEIYRELWGGSCPNTRGMFVCPR